MHNDTLIVAIGGAGRAIADSVRRHIRADLLLINTKAQLQASDANRSVFLETAGVEGAFTSVDHARAAGLLKQDQIAARLTKYQRIILTVGLGGATGSGVAPVVARLASELNKDVMAVVTLPFAVEGSRIAIAHTALAELEPLCTEIVVHDHEKVTSLMAFDSLDEALQRVAYQLVQQVSVLLP